MKTDIISANNPSAIKHAIDVLHHGGLIAFPTDTVYGLAAPVFDEDSIDRLYFVKGRTHTKAIAVLLSKIGQLPQVTSGINIQAQKLAKKFWPGPLTIVLPRHPDLPEILAPEPTIGVRIPDHPFALSLMDQTGPLAVTSANLSGSENACTAQEVMKQLKGRIHLIIDDGPTPGGIPSTVVDCTTPETKILRSGPVSNKQIEQALS
jgi:L-threonylcarbamoyladenylate synthase